MVEDGDIVFHVRERGFGLKRIFGWDDASMQMTAISIGREGKPVWRMEILPGDRACPEGRTFPVRYGAARCGMRVTVPAERLARGGRYDVRLGTPCGVADFPKDGFCNDWQAWISASFIVRSDGSIDNIPPDE
jgi:hypothetical protein